MKKQIHILHQIVDDTKEFIGAYSTGEKAIKQILIIEKERENLSEDAETKDINWDYWELDSYDVDMEFLSGEKF